MSERLTSGVPHPWHLLLPLSFAMNPTPSLEFDQIRDELNQYSPKSGRWFFPLLSTKNSKQNPFSQALILAEKEEIVKMGTRVIVQIGLWNFEENPLSLTRYRLQCQFYKKCKGMKCHMNGYCVMHKMTNYTVSAVAVSIGPHGDVP